MNDCIFCKIVKGDIPSKKAYEDDKILGPTGAVGVPEFNTRFTREVLLDTSELNAKVLFSFLDYQQLKLPIMKQLFQLFQPISKGFAASVQGTFENPKWTLSFNPFRFVLPEKKVRKNLKN